MNTQVLIAIIGAIFGVAGGAAAAAAINAYANREIVKAETDNTVVTTAEILMARQQEQIDRGDIERSEQRDQLRDQHQEIVALRAEVRELREREAERDAERLELLEIAKRFKPIENLITMLDFVDNGWLADLNKHSAHPRGVHVYLYNDDVDEQVALGHGVLPVELVPIGKLPTLEELDKISDALDRYANRVREEAGLTPFERIVESPSPDD